MRLLITGGTGLVGRQLAVAAANAGHEVLVLSRALRRATPLFPNSVTVIAGDPTQAGRWQERAAACDAIINLAGENLFARRWDTAFKQTLRDSRLQATRQVVEAFRRAGCRTRMLVNASAVGYYGDGGTMTFREDSPPGTGFLPEMCGAWEAEAAQAASHGVRVVTLRIGIVLDAAGGALAQLLPAFRWFVGGPVGSGRQTMSWIHIADLIGLILHALETESLSGAVNATAPHPVTNQEFATTLGRVLGRPAFLKTPGWVIKCVLGEAADVVLKGQRVLPAKAEESGYPFKFPFLEDALRDLLSRPTSREDVKE